MIDNPRFGVVHHLRTLSLHAVVLYLGTCLAQLGWAEFVYWGKGPIGRVLLSPSKISTQATVSCDGFYDDDSVVWGNDGDGECSIGGSEFGVAMASTDTER